MCLVALVVVALIGGLVVLAKTTESPAQRAAAAKPPAERPVEVDVVRRPLRSEVVVRARSEPLEQLDVPVAAVSASPADVVTGRPIAEGGNIDAGQVALQVSGRPVIALEGEVPLYRDLLPGTTGPDVDALRSALAAIGLGSNDPAGSYGPSTQAAVVDLYRRVGADVPTDPTAREQLEAGLRTLAEANDALSESKLALARSAAAENAAIRDAEAQHENAALALIGVQQKAARDEALLVSRIDGLRADAAAMPGDREAETRLRSAVNELADLQEANRIAIAEASTAARVPAAPAGDPTSAQDVARAERDKAGAERAVDAAMSAAGPVARWAELLIVPSLPAVLTGLPRVGRTVGEGVLARIESRRRALRVRVDDDLLDQLQVGMPATVNLPAGATALRIERIDRSSPTPEAAVGDGTDGSSTRGADGVEASGGLVTLVSETDLPVLSGTVPVAIELAPAIEGALVVPASSLVRDGPTARVSLRRGSHRTTIVVAVLGVADGFAAVRPVHGADLRDGDAVVVE